MIMLSASPITNLPVNISPAIAYLIIACVILLVVALAIAVMLRPLLLGAICLGVGSVILTIILYLMGAVWAAVFELSVCAGLITVVFISTIALANVETSKEEIEKIEHHKKRFTILIVILLAALVLGLAAAVKIKLNGPSYVDLSTQLDFAKTLWQSRQTDIIGQIIIVLAGVFGVTMLFKERESK